MACKAKIEMENSWLERHRAPPMHLHRENGWNPHAQISNPTWEAHPESSSLIFVENL
jgi:hypothetical protein